MEHFSFWSSLGIHGLMIFSLGQFPAILKDGTVKKHVFSLEVVNVPSIRNNEKNFSPTNLSKNSEISDTTTGPSKKFSTKKQIPSLKAKTGSSRKALEEDFLNIGEEIVSEFEDDRVEVGSRVESIKTEEAERLEFNSAEAQRKITEIKNGIQGKKNSDLESRWHRGQAEQSKILGLLAQKTMKSGVPSRSTVQKATGIGKGRMGDGLGQNIRALSELRQKSGNLLPTYSLEERRLGLQGLLKLWAYINRGGLVDRVELRKSSGHRSLDVKSMKALKKWSFYPGQEGWVEVPFHWNLKGEAQLLGGLLRK